jgi:hypothetical protein
MKELIMRVTLSVLALFLFSCMATGASSPSATAATGDMVLKSCSFEQKFPGDEKGIQTVITVSKHKNGTVGKTSEMQEGKMTDLPIQKAEINEFSVRDGLQNEPKDMNLAERLIRRTQETLNDFDIGKYFNIGFDVNQIRKARVYQIGDQTASGYIAIIEGKDETGKLLGTYVTTVFPYPCK